MKGDFSKLGFDPDRHYSRVLLQQGRVQLDSDWNEQAEITAHRIETSLHDLIGPAGASDGDRGFDVTVRSALSFDGKGGHGRVEFREFDLHHKPFTFTLWVRPSNGGPVLARSAESGGQEFLLAVDNDGSVSLHHEEFGSAASAREVASVGSLEFADGPKPRDENRKLRNRILHANRKIPANHFTHIAIVRHEHGLAIYLDGTLCAKSRGWGAGPQSHGHLLLGAQHVGSGLQGFSGEIGSVCVWHAALSPELILESLDSPAPPRADEIAVHWLFDGQGGEVISDRSGHDHYLALRRGPGGGPPPSRSRSLWIEKGRYYVDGVCCENERPVLFSDQPDYPDAILPASAHDHSRYLAYLEVSERYISHIEDPAIRESALGGPDTTGRVRTQWQVKLLPVEVGDAHPESAGQIPEWRAMLAARRVGGRLSARRQPSGSTLENQLYRVEIHNPVGEDKTASPEDVEARLLAGKQLTVDSWEPDGRPWTVGEIVELLIDSRRYRAETTAAAMITGIDQPRGVIDLDDLPVRVATGTRLRIRRTATFKWSRENGSVAFGITAHDATAGKVVIESSLPDQYTLNAGDWVEVGDDRTVLLKTKSALCQIVDVDPLKGELMLDRWPPEVAGNLDFHPFLRRWDQSASNADLKQGVVPVLAGQWIALESGVEVLFDGSGPYRADDYWLIPARTSTADVEWPRDDFGPVAQSSPRAAHLCAPLALLHFGPHGPEVLRSYRVSFPSLGGLSRAVSDSVQRTGDVMTGPLLIENTLSVRRTLFVEGDAQVGLLRGRLEPQIVGTEQLQDRSVTIEKLAFDIDPGPAGIFLLSASQRPPDGCRYSGSSVVIFYPQSLRGEHHDSQPEGGRACAVSIGDHIYALFESGAFWRFDFGTNRWHEHDWLHPRRRNCAIAASDGKVYVLGGEDEKGITGRSAEYDPSSDRWTARATMPTPRCGLAAVVLDGRIHALGGEKPSWFGRRTTAIHEIYKPEIDEWETRPPMIRRRSRAGAVVHRGRIRVVGGESKSFLGLLGRLAIGECEEFDSSLGTWSLNEPLPFPRSQLGLAEFGGKLYAVGGELPSTFGFRREILNTVQRHSFEFDVWANADHLPMPLSSFSAVTVSNGLYAIGGHRPGKRSAPVLMQIASIYYIHQKLTD